ncbi:hypothetical protein G3N59_27300 [Paraburkholderia sp. Ac-20340]|uniref:DUF6708 domain-containing protein n=1 Tax=Paraburkholderia sp. Ac-20340 TaxID=2703888 RepID=UPI00197EA1C0|nr:DUF6708 domain-containing protein [Paraburkholderia sp. Ac-20340]MBN3857094.1 hypothetical protein [Paraburkholderia sp. Ac-20340]
MFKNKKQNYRRSFEEELVRLKNSKDRLALPLPDLAMWKGDVRFWTDLNDSARYNNQYIESQFSAESTVSDSYLISTWHTVTLIATILGCITTRKISFLIFFGEFFSLMLLWLVLWLIKMPSGRIRFNRKAQIVHFFWGRRLISIPWRNAYPFAQIVRLGSVDLDIFFPTKYCADKTTRAIISRTGKFDVADVGLDSAFYRWEFIRRYMEEGLEAIAPSEHPEPGFEPRKASGQFRKTFDIFYYLGFGFLIDRWAAYWNARFRWPEEVERLCRSDADLTGYDASPVASSKTHFYRFDPRQGGYYICDAQGNELRDATRAERAATYPSSVMK